MSRGRQRGTGRRTGSRLATVALALGGLTAGTAAVVMSAIPAGAQPITSCSTTSGVIVVVDFAHWGGAIERGCAADSSTGSTTGLRALHTAGFATVGVSEYGTAFICRIDTKPTQAATSCDRTPPSSAYWSYWHWSPGVGQTTWSYSQAGVANYQPPPGSVTLWVFGGTTDAGTPGTGHPPATLTPTKVRATNTTPTGGGSTTPTTTPAPTTTAPSSGGGTVTTSPTTTPAPTATAPSSGGGTVATSPTPAPSTTLPSSPTTTAPKTGSKKTDRGKTSGTQKNGAHKQAIPKIVDVAPAAARQRTSSGSPLPFVIGAIVVIVLGTAGVLVAWHRRRTAG